MSATVRLKPDTTYSAHERCCDGMKDRWFRRRPSDDEMREELEAHVAMRAEHDRVDEAAARRRLGNMLHTRESMRRVWIAEWWDALRQDAHFTWRSWRRRPAFALAAILVLALGLGASTALFAALDRVLFRPLPYADPDRLVSVGRITVPLVFQDQTESMIDTFYVQEWDTPPAPFQSVTAMLVRARRADIAEEQPEGMRCGRVEHNFLRVLGVRVALGRDFAPEDDVRGAPPVALISHGLWVRRFGADPRVVERTLSLESWAIAAAGPASSASCRRSSRCRSKPPTSCSRLNCVPSIRTAGSHVDHGARTTQAGRDTRAREADAGAPVAGDAGRSPAVRIPRGMARAAAARPAGRRCRARRLAAHGRGGRLPADRLRERHQPHAGARRPSAAGSSRSGPPSARAGCDSRAWRSPRACCSRSRRAASGSSSHSPCCETFVAMAPPGIPGIADASIDLRVFVVAALLVVVTGTAIGVWPAISVFRVGALHGLRSTVTSSPGARPRVRFALVTTQIALTLALLGGSALLLRSLWNVVNVPLGFDAERVVTLSAALSRVRYPTVEHGAVFFDELLARARAMPGAVSAALSNAPPPPLLPGPSVVGRGRRPTGRAQRASASRSASDR